MEQSELITSTLSIREKLKTHSKPSIAIHMLQVWIVEVIVLQSSGKIRLMVGLWRILVYSVVQMIFKEITVSSHFYLLVLFLVRWI